MPSRSQAHEKMRPNRLRTITRSLVIDDLTNTNGTWMGTMCITLLFYLVSALLVATLLSAILSRRRNLRQFNQMNNRSAHFNEILLNYTNILRNMLQRSSSVRHSITRTLRKDQPRIVAWSIGMVNTYL